MPSSHEDANYSFPAATSPGAVSSPFSLFTSSSDRPAAHHLGPSVGSDPHVPPSQGSTVTYAGPIPIVSPLLLGRDMSDQSHSLRPPSRRLTSPRGSRPSQGSALETLSTLLLNHETHGKAAALSAAREGPTTASALSNQLSNPIRTLRGLGSKLSVQDYPTESAGSGRLGTVSGMPTFEVRRPSLTGNVCESIVAHDLSDEDENAPSCPYGRENGLYNPASASATPRNGTPLPTLPGAWVGSPSSPQLWSRPAPQSLMRKSSLSSQAHGPPPGLSKHDRFDSASLPSTYHYTSSFRVLTYGVSKRSFGCSSSL